MRRREFISLLGGATANLTLAPRIASAQQRAMPVIGVLHPQSAEAYSGRLRALHRGLKEAGFVEGENVMIDYRWAENQLDRLPALAAELVQRQVAVIFTGTSSAALAAKAATTTTPVVFVIAEDPVRLGLVASLARPDGNATGINFLTGELPSKRLELLRELLPTARRVAVLVNPANPVVTETRTKAVEEAARAMGLQIQVLNASSSRDIAVAFAAIARERPDALFVLDDPLYSVRRVQLVNLASRHAMPASYGARESTEAGGLMSYGANVADAWRQASVYAGRILKGAKPADLPVVQASKFELVVNAETARMLDLVVPASLLAIADEVIE
jgi:ABC-type uncharacterized transport system substrate-binding protein